MTADEPRLVLVDADDRAIGEAGRAECHAGDGKLHRAFSLHVITGDGSILLQRRAAPKPSVCAASRTARNSRLARPCSWQM